jgi:regulator of sigma E protease
MPYVLAFLGFAALIILHEAGHFTAAKLVGMRVERFSLFFGPMVWKFRRGETEYGIGVIPAGGYVKISGMNPHEIIPEEVRPRAYYNQPVWKRVVVILAGPFVNVVIAFLLLAGIYATQGNVTASTTVADTIGAPASTVLKHGDQIVAVDGKRNLSVQQISTEISSHRCASTPPTNGCRATSPVTLLVKRDGALRTFTLAPRYSAADKRTLIGFDFGANYGSESPVTAAGQSVSEMWLVTHKTVTAFAKIFEPKDRSQLHGIVGAATVTEQEFSFDATQALWTLALISLSLAVVNLFPFLPLDGGHVFWAVAEKVRGRRISFDVMEKAGAAGFVLIILIFAIGLSNDVSTLSSGGFHIH